MEGWKDKALFTPGPLTTSRTVKQALLRDFGSRDTAFIELVRDIRRGLLQIACDRGEHEAVLMQGSGTFGIESVIGSATPPDGKWLFLKNGAYGRRLEEIARVLKIDTVSLEFPERSPIDPGAVEEALRQDGAITHVGMVHCETSTGMLQPAEEVAQIARRHGKEFFLDAMSSFGAVPIDPETCPADYLVSSANKCIEGVPGFSFVIARRDALLKTEGRARSLSLDLFAQWRGLEKNGQFRFTPPTHAIAGFRQALLELEAEGGVAGRAKRYAENHKTLVAGMRKLGFQEYLPPELQSYIITAFRYPEDGNFSFERFYETLSVAGYLIYPGKVSDANCFRIGTIGRLFPSDIQALLAAASR